MTHQLILVFSSSRFARLPCSPRVSEFGRSGRAVVRSAEALLVHHHVGLRELGLVELPILGLRHAGSVGGAKGALAGKEPLEERMEVETPPVPGRFPWSFSGGHAIHVIVPERQDLLTDLNGGS